MSTHLYCVLPLDGRAALPAGLLGVNDAPVRARAVGELVGWVSDAERATSVTVDAIKAHDAVVQAALETGTTPMPARFGQRFADDAACAVAIGRHAESIRSVLDGVQGFVEMTLILTPSTRRMIADLEPVLPEMVGETPGIGRKYLETLRAREAATGTVRRALDALAEKLTDAAHEFIRRASVHESLVRIPFRSVSHLVARELVEQYRTTVQAVRPSADSQFLVVGPRAPYSFSSLVPGDGGFHGMKLAD
jgi:hypothetical protein